MTHNLNEICFDDFRLSFGERCLFHGKEIVSLTGKEYEILAALLEAQGLVVQKEDLGKKLWGDRTVEESNLPHHVRSLRKKLEARGSGSAYIETVAGRGYRFAMPAEPEVIPVSDSLEVKVEATPEAISPAAPAELAPVSGKWRYAGLVLLILLVLAALITGSLILARRKAEPASAPVTVAVLTTPEATNVPRVLKVIAVKGFPSTALGIAERHEIYVSEPENDSVAVIDVRSDEVVDRIQVGTAPSQLRLSPDGKHVFIGEERGGLGVIDTATRGYQRFPGVKERVLDVALTPDGKNAYLALGFTGLGKVNLPRRSFSIVSKIVYVKALALTPDGKRLYASYQAGGPGGSKGHDAIGYFDTATDRFAGAITGFANVGECMSASPDGAQIWENGEDACDSPQYDHIGCPVVPGGLLNIINTGTNKLARAEGVKGARLQCTTFSADGEFAVVASSDHLLLIRAKDMAITASLPVGSTGRLALTPDGLRAYVPVNAKAEVAVVQMGVPVEVVRLTNGEESDETLQVAIRSTAEFDAKSIDPETLRLDGVAVERTPQGMLAASVEHVSGSDGHSLIVRFRIDAARVNLQLRMVGKTYSGIPIRGIVDSL